MSKQWKIALVILAIWIILASVIMYVVIRADNLKTDKLFREYQKIQLHHCIDEYIASVVINHPLKGENNRFVKLEDGRKFFVITSHEGELENPEIDLSEALVNKGRVRKVIKSCSSDTITIINNGKRYHFLLTFISDNE